MNFDVDFVRKQFPSLALKVNGYPAAYFDGPGGTQTPQCVIDAMVDYLTSKNANIGHSFQTAQDTYDVISEARKALADFLGCLWEEVAFGHNMTTLNTKLALALARDMKAGDEIIITQIDHEANRGPWLNLQERDIVIREVKMDLDTCTVDLDDFQNKLSDKTKIAAFNYASNAVGTISDVRSMIKWVHEAGALAVVDAVHYALHGPIDVREIEADFLLCSAYKFFGPHLGVIYGKKDVFEKTRTYKIKPQYDDIPFKIETGTLNHEGIAGAAAAVDFIADIGAKYVEDFIDQTPKYSGRRRNIISGMLALEAYEQPLAQEIIDGLSQIEKVKIYGPPPGHPRTSTVSFIIKGVNSQQVAQVLGEKGLFVWDGHFYACRLVECLGLEEQGGLVRVGLAPYNTNEEMERLLFEVKKLAS
ncbi:MAG: aminotransferase [Phycisphaerae bacterium SM23_30]|nr:MAG: aminotransferase [Phycisphaerae bacterium SM23_30]